MKIHQTLIKGKMVATMGWAIPDQQGWRKGPWTPEEDKLLGEYVKLHGEGRWTSVARGSDLNRSGKSCRLRWVNYLRPGLKKGQITPQEEGIIIELHALWGNKWSTIARYLPGRTDNEIKNYWRTHFKKRERASQRQAKKRAQIMKQKWQQDQQQQQEQLLGVMNNETKMADEGANNNHNINQLEEILAMCNSPSLEDQFQCMTSMIPHEDVVVTSNYSCKNNNNNNQNWADQDTGLWAGLWDLDDLELHNVDDLGNQLVMENQVPAGASVSNFYGGGGTFTEMD